MSKYDWKQLEKEYILSDNKSVSNFLKEKGIKNNGTVRKHTSGWKTKKRQKEDKKATKTIEKTIEKESEKEAKNYKEKKKILKEEYGTISGFVNFIYREEIYAKEHSALMIECEID